MENESGATPRSVGGQKNGRGGGDTRRRKGGGGWSSGGRKGEGGFRGLGWVGQTDPDRVNSECTLLRGGLRFAENISPFHPRPECATPSLPRWTMRFRNMNRRGGWPKPVFTTQCFEGTWEGRRRRGKVSGVFSLILSSFFSVFRFFFSFFFSRSRCKFLRLRFLLLLFSLFFFSIVKKGILGETFSVCCYRWSCVVVVFDLSDDSFFFWRRNFNWMMKEGILVINNMDSFLFFFYLELWKYI